MRVISTWRSFLLAMAVLATAGNIRADSLSFTTIPDNGTVSGPAGSTVGWGFSITNTSMTDYLDISSIDSTLFLATDGTPDASIFLFPNLAPGQTAFQPYDPADGLGLFQFTWNSDLPVGTTESGNFTLYGAFCDPSVDQFCAEDGSVPSIALASAAFSATVSASSGGNPNLPVPEPSALLLLTSGLSGIGLCMRHFKATARRQASSNRRGGI